MASEIGKARTLVVAASHKSQRSLPSINPNKARTQITIKRSQAMTPEESNAVESNAVLGSAHKAQQVSQSIPTLGLASPKTSEDTSKGPSIGRFTLEIQQQILETQNKTRRASTNALDIEASEMEKFFRDLDQKIEAGPDDDDEATQPIETSDSEIAPPENSQQKTIQQIIEEPLSEMNEESD